MYEGKVTTLFVCTLHVHYKHNYIGHVDGQRLCIVPISFAALSPERGWNMKPLSLADALLHFVSSEHEQQKYAGTGSQHVHLHTSFPFNSPFCWFYMIYLCVFVLISICWCFSMYRNSSLFSSHCPPIIFLIFLSPFPPTKSILICHCPAFVFPQRSHGLTIW